MSKLLLAVILLLTLVVAGCTSAETATQGDGETLIRQTLLGQAPGCATCHSFEPGVKLVGPSLAGIASRAEAIVQDPAYTGSAANSAEFLHESILNPDAFVPDGFIKGTMYQDYAEHLSQEQIDALVNYMLTLQ
jgi:cytochrome c2